MAKIKISIVVVGALLLCVLSSLLTYFTLSSAGVIETGKIDITYQVLDKNIEYNGSSNTADEVKLISGELMSGDTATIEYIGSQTEVGELDITAKISIFNVDGVEKTSKYNISVIPGKLEITKRKINLKLQACEKVYDGKPLYVKEFLDSGQKLLSGHMIVPNYTKSVVNYGETVYGEMIAEIFDVYGRDVTSNYDISYDNTAAELKITKRPAVFTTLSFSKEYDGLEFDLSKYSNTVEVNGLLEGHSYQINHNSEYMIKDVGTQINVIANGSIQIFDKNNNDVTTNYEIINRNLGVLTVTPCKLASEYKYPTIQFNGQTQKLSFSLQNLLSDELYKHFQTLGYSVKASTNQQYNLINVGTYDYQISFNIFDGAGNDVTSNFDKSSIDTTFKITPLDVTVQTLDLEAEYSGKKFELPKDYQDDLSKYVILNYNNDKNFLDLITTLEYEVSLSYDKEYVDIGNYANVIAFKVFNNGLEVTSNFNFVYNSENIGKLVISPIAITVAPKPMEYTYTGEEIIINEFDVTRKNGSAMPLMDGHHIVAECNKQFINVTKDEKVAIKSCIVLDSSGNDVTSNYKIEYKESTLTIKAREITIDTLDDRIEFDGKEDDYKTVEGKNNVSNVTGLVDGHYVVATYQNSVSCFSPISDNVIKNLIIYDKNGDIVTDNYKYIINEIGKIQLVPRTVEFSIESKTLTYTGTYIDYKFIFNDEVFNAEEVDININTTASDLIKNVGKYTDINVSFSIKYKDSSDEYKADYFNFVNTNEGSITINPYDIYVKIPTEQSQMFNGQNVYLDYTFAADISGVQSNTLSDDIFSIKASNYLSPGKTEVNVNLLSYNVTDSKGNIITSNYNINWKKNGESGEVSTTEEDVFASLYKLKYTKKSISFVGASVNKEYDGRSYSKKFEVSILNDTLPEGCYYEVDYKCFNSGQTYKNVGSYDLNYSIQMFMNINGKKVNVSDNYNIVVSSATLIIKPLSVIIVTTSESMQYNGYPIECSIDVDKSYIPDCLDTESFITNFDFPQIGPDVGSYSSYVIYTAEDSANYDITYNYGITTITKAPLTVIGESRNSGNYVGSEVYQTIIATCGDNEYQVLVQYISYLKNPSDVCENRFKVLEIYSGSTTVDVKNFDITCIYGELKSTT